MKKKLQIFISSTFSDLQTERQSAVETILRAGHIPAGMELFSAGNESQLDIIKRWIDESDVYMLILGGRYGSIEKESSLSYTEIEYNYALAKSKPVFAIVATEELLNSKVKVLGADALERKAVDKYEKFRELVLSKICRFFSDISEIKISIFESLLDIQNRYELKGWVRFDDVPDLSALMTQISNLQEEVDKHKNASLEKISTRSSGKKQEYLFGGLSYIDLAQVLGNKKMKIPIEVAAAGTKTDSSYFGIFVSNSGSFNTGLDNLTSASAAAKFLYKIASELMVFGLIEQSYVKEGTTTKSVLKTSSDGMKFIAEYQLRKYNVKPPVKNKISAEDKTAN